MCPRQCWGTSANLPPSSIPPDQLLRNCWKCGAHFIPRRLRTLMHVVLHHNSVLPPSHHSSSIEKILGPISKKYQLERTVFGRCRNSREPRIGAPFIEASMTLVGGKPFHPTKLARKDAQTNQTGPTSIMDSKGKGSVIGLHYPNPHSLALRRRTAKKREFSYAVYRGLSSLEHVYCSATRAGGVIPVATV